MENTFVFLKGSNKLRNYAIFIGFLIGFAWAYWFQSHYYFYFDYMSLCFITIHWHHLYSGSIALIVLLLFYRKFSVQNNKYFLFYFLLIGIALGVILDDITTHFLFQIDPWIFYCSERP